MPMRVVPTAIPDVLLIELDAFQDDRGVFYELHRQLRYSSVGVTDTFVQDNFSRSAHGVLRGLHYQLERPQAKLVTVLSGRVFDVAVDIRRSSPTFGRWVGCELSGDCPQQLYIPRGFAHGFCVLSESADFLYKCSDVYSPSGERGIIWNDPALAISWPIEDPHLSAKDRAFRTFREMEADLPQ